DRPGLIKIRSPARGASWIKRALRPSRSSDAPQSTSELTDHLDQGVEKVRLCNRDSACQAHAVLDLVVFGFGPLPIEPSQHLGPDNTRNVRDACSGRIQRWILGEREDRPDLSRYLLRSWGGQLQKRALRHQIIVYRTVRKQAILHLAHLEKM